MPKYHFEITDGFRLEDPVGVDCSDDAEAKHVAKGIARQIAVDIASESNRNVIVVDDSGDEVYKTAIVSPKLTT
jgi:hypothetical protein